MNELINRERERVFSYKQKGGQALASSPIEALGGNPNG